MNSQAEGVDLAWPPSKPSEPTAEGVDLAWPPLSPSEPQTEGVDLAWPPSQPSKLRRNSCDRPCGLCRSFLKRLRARNLDVFETNNQASEETFPAGNETPRYAGTTSAHSGCRLMIRLLIFTSNVSSLVAVSVNSGRRLPNMTRMYHIRMYQQWAGVDASRFV